MRVIVAGASGLLGTEVLREFRSAPGVEVLGLNRSGGEGLSVCDLQDAAALRSVFVEFAPDLVINCAAYTAVDRAEEEREEAMALNGELPRALSGLCAELDARLFQISTDYVFSGDKTGAYLEDDAVGPRSVYGESKLAGERAVLESGADALVIRVAWLYGPTGPNFAATMLRLAESHPELKVVDDQRGTPTYTPDLAAQIFELRRHSGLRGIVHATNQGETTWYGFTRALLDGAGKPEFPVHPCSTEDFPRPAPRPANSVLANSRLQGLGCDQMRPWQHAVGDYLASRN